MDSIVQHHAAAMLVAARSVVRDHALAEDVVQESLLKVWRAWPTVRVEASRRSWVLRITHNTAVSTLRARKDVCVAPDELHDVLGSTDISPERIVIGRSVAETSWDALARLDPKCREIVIRRALDGASYLEIAAALDLPLPTVKTRLFRARRSMAADLASWLEDEDRPETPPQHPLVLRAPIRENSR